MRSASPMIKLRSHLFKINTPLAFPILEFDPAEEIDDSLLATAVSSAENMAAPVLLYTIAHCVVSTI